MLLLTLAILSLQAVAWMALLFDFAILAAALLWPSLLFDI